MRVTYIGHATLLIEIGGKVILTDPNFDPALGRFLSRVSPPGIALEKLPQLDAILVTHAHADHLSFDSLNRLPEVPIFAPPVVASWLAKRGYKKAEPLAPGTNTRLDDVTIHAASAKHKGHRYGYDRWRSDANMYLLDSGTTSSFFAGDTALTPETTHLVDKHIKEEGRTLDVALLPIGHAPWWKPGFRSGHLTSDDALELFTRLEARYLIPYHWGTFNHVTSTAFDAIEVLRCRITGNDPHHRCLDVRVLEPGTTFTTPPSQTPPRELK